MPYIGNTIRAADDYRLIDDISSSFNGSTTSFALQVAGSAPVPFPKSPQQVLISVNGVIQEPDPSGSSGFNLVGTNIVFSSAPANGHAFFGIIYATADYLNAGGNFPAGSLGAPSITFIGDENTGLYRKGGGSIGFVADATEIANTDSNGLTISSGNILLGDSSGATNNRIKFGTSQDLQIYHDGGHSTILDNGTGNIKLYSNGAGVDIQKSNGENMALFKTDGAVELYFDNSKKAETVTGGFTVTGVCTATSFAGDGSSLSGINTDLVSDTSPQLGGTLDTNGQLITFPDSAGATSNRLKFGAGGDLEIYHDGTNSRVHSLAGTQKLKIGGPIIEFVDEANFETLAKFTSDGSCELYHNNVKKIETTSAGVSVSGSLTADGGSAITLGDSKKIILGTGSDFEIYHNGTNGIIDNNTGNLSIQTTANLELVIQSILEIKTKGGTENCIRGITDGAVELYHDGTKRAETYSNGFRVGNVTIDSTTGGSFFGADSNRGGIHFSVTSVLPCNSSGSVVDNSIDLGSSSARWQNIFTADLNLSNRGSQNDVDSTWGDYTIQEGYEELFLINHRTGKKFKFNLTEVS